MLLVKELIDGEIRVRILACDECEPEEDCDTRFLVFQARHDQLWVCLVLAEGGDDAAAEELAKVFEQIEDLPDIIDLYTALAGMTWPMLISSGRACLDQVLVCNQTPKWMLRLDRDLIWQTRRSVFGHDLTRVHRALWAMHRYYEPDAPALEPWAR